MADEVDLRSVDGEAGDGDLLVEDERDQLDADLDLLGLKEGFTTEGRVIGDRGVFCDEAAAKDREVELAESGFAADGGGDLLLDAGAEVVGVQEERNGQGDEKDKGEEAAEDDEESSVTGCHLDPSFELMMQCSLPEAVGAVRVGTLPPIYLRESIHSMQLSLMLPV